MPRLERRKNHESARNCCVTFLPNSPRPRLGTTACESHAALGGRVGGPLQPGSGQSSLANPARGAALRSALCSWPFGFLGLPGLEIRVPAPEPVATHRRASPVASIGRDKSAGQTCRLLQREPTGPSFRRKADEFCSSDHDSRYEVRPPEAARPVRVVRGSIAVVADVLLGVWGFGVALLVIRLAIAVRQTRKVAADFAGRVGRDCRRGRANRRRVGVPSRRASPKFAADMPCRSCTGCDVRYWFCRSGCASRPIAGSCPGVIAHELAHVGSWDFAWNAALQAASMLLWFHPLAWRIGSAHRAACDAVCDAVAASYLGDVRRIAGRSRRWRWRERPLSRLGLGHGPDLRCPPSHRPTRSGLVRVEIEPSRYCRCGICGIAFDRDCWRACGSPRPSRSPRKRVARSSPLPRKTRMAAKRPRRQGQTFTAIRCRRARLPGWGPCRVSLRAWRHPGSARLFGQQERRRTHVGLPPTAKFPARWNLADGKLVRTVRPADITETRVFAQPLAGPITPDGKIAAAWIGGYHLPPGGGKPFPALGSSGGKSRPVAS